MSEQGKMPVFWTIRDKEHWEEKEQLRDRLAAAETAETEYAKQVKKLQEEVERLKCCGNCCFWRSGESKGEMNCQEFNNMPFKSRHHFEKCDHWGAKVRK